MTNWITKIKTKWEIKSDWDFWMIMLTFSLAGMFIMPARKIVFHILGITDHSPLWFKALIYIPLIFPVYQLGLLVFGSLLGQFSFFWEKEKRLIRFILRRN